MLTHLYLDRYISAVSRCQELSMKSIPRLSPQSRLPANNNVVLDSANPSDSKTIGTLGAIKDQNSQSKT